MLSCCGMYQNQPLLVRRLQHHRRAFVAAGVAVGALPVGPDRALVEDRVPDAQAQAVLDAGRPGRWRRRRPWRAPRARAVLVADGHADGAVALEEHVEHAHAFVRRRRRARARCRASSGRTRCAPPARSASTRAACCPRSRTAPTACRCALTNCTLYFLTKWLCLHLRQHVEPLEHPVGLGDQRFADVEAREALALEELDAARPAGRAAWTRWTRRGRRR